MNVAQPQSTPTGKVAATIPKISLANYASRKTDIQQQLVDAAEGAGFFILVDHALSETDISTMFSASKSFFSLPDEVKSSSCPFQKMHNRGWEKMSQVRPSTGTADMKESLQLQHSTLEEFSIPVDGFKATAERFLSGSQEISNQILSCFSVALGFDEDFLPRSNDMKMADSLSTLRLLHYHDVTGQTFPSNYWRAGAHTDFDLLTLLFQQVGENGLEVCPGREASTSFAMGDTWTPVTPLKCEIIVNIGDMLMAWSDDRFKSNFHRVKTPGLAEYQGPRYSIAWFNQAAKSVVVKGPKGVYPPMTAEEYIQQAMRRNFEHAETLRAQRVAVA